MIAQRERAIAMSIQTSSLSTHETPHEDGHGLTRALATFAAGLAYEDLPAEAAAKLKMCLFDTLGCTVWATANLDQIKTLIAGMRPEFPAGPAPVWGTPIATSAGMAALINGTSAHAFQFDEVHTGAVVHPGPAIFPALLGLASAQAAPVSGKRLLAAAAAGYEIGVRVGLAFDGALFKNGFHAQGVIGSVAAAAAGARLLDLDLERFLNAIGIGASQSTGIMAVQRGSNTKSFHSGKAAQAGVYAAMLAAQGFTGVDDAFDPGYGLLFEAFTDVVPDMSAAKGLNEKWHLLDVSFKLAPAANGSLSGAEALGRVLDAHGIRAERIAKVTAHVSTNTLHHCGWDYDPSPANSPLTAQMSLRYGMAARALDGNLAPRQFLQPRISAPDIATFLPRIDVQVEPRYDVVGAGLRLAARVEVECTDGQRFSEEVLYRKGTSQQPVTADEIEAKFRSLMPAAFGPAEIDGLCDVVAALDACDDVRGLVPVKA